ncbi:MAG: hypothetical protein Q6367_006365 [Candidatus Freyarchaeota archaeon]
MKTISELSRIVTVTPEIALGSAECYLELLQEAKKEKLRDPSLFDAITLAVTKHLKAKVLTGDEHFKNLSETLWLNSGETKRGNKPGHDCPPSRDARMLDTV